MVFWFTRCADSSRYQSKTFLQPCVFCVFVREQLLETPVHFELFVSNGENRSDSAWHWSNTVYYPSPPPATYTAKKERNFRRDRMQSHIWLTTNSYMSLTKYLRRFFLSYDFAPDPFKKFLIYDKNFPKFLLWVCRSQCLFAGSSP